MVDYSNMEMRAVYGTTLNELIDENPNVLYLEADLSKASGTNPSVAAEHPKNFINVGVVEANMIGIAAGLAREGSDLTLVSTGSMTHFAIEAAEQLSRLGIRVEHLHCGSVKPIDSESLVRSASKTRAVVTVETRNIIGGLGGAVCEVLSEQCPTLTKRLGIPDRFGEVATEEYLFDKHGFGIRHIVDTCKQMKERKPQ